MIDFEKQAEITIKASNLYEEIKKANSDNFDQFEVVNKIDDLAVAKRIIKWLLSEKN